MKKLYSILFICSTWLFTAQILETNKANLQADGCVTYEVDVNQNRIPDFSHAGYKGGGLAIPDISVEQTISPIAGDNTAHIQAAIDAVGNLPLDANGFRGAVLLNPGTYEVSGQLFMNKSGVVLRGSGDGRETTNPTIIQGIGNVPDKRDLIELGGGNTGAWDDQVPGTQQNITTNFVQVGSRSFDVADASPYTVGDNIIVFHPSTQAWIDAVDGGGVIDDPEWSVGQYPIQYNRFITAINGNEITIDAPVYNHLDKSLSQSYIFTFDRQNMRTNIGIENLRIDIIPSDINDPFDENHAESAVAFHEVEDGWARNITATGFEYAGVKTRKASRITVRNAHAIDPIAAIAGGNRYNFAAGNFSNNILFDNCYANDGRHTYAVNGTPSASGIVFLRSISENPLAASEPHRQWSNGILYDNLRDFGTLPGSRKVLALNNRSDGGSSHGWAAVNSVLWNVDVSRPGLDGIMILEKPPIGQNYAIGTKGVIENNIAPLGYIEHSNATGQLEIESLYEAQLLCRTNAVISNFVASSTEVTPGETVTFTDNSQGSVTSYNWDFGQDATPATATGVGPHDVSYSTTGQKTVKLTVSNGTQSDQEIKSPYITVRADNLSAADDNETLDQNSSVTTLITSNDITPTSIPNKSLLFNGSTDDSTGGSVFYDQTDLINDYPFTMMAWFKTTSTENRTLLYFGNSSSNATRHSVMLNNGSILMEARVRISSGNTPEENINYSASLNDGVWHHVAAVHESPTSRKLYVDGVEVGTNTNNFDSVTPQQLSSFSAGNRDDRNPDSFFNGEIDDVRLYGFSLSNAEINNALQGYECSAAERLIKWDFNNQPSATAEDQFNSFDGSIAGSTTDVPSTLSIGDLDATIISGPSNGTATFTNDFEITYTPNNGFTGTDSLSYQLRFGDCEVSQATITYTVQNLLCDGQDYVGNTNTGFGGVLGQSTLKFDDDGTTITGSFTKGSNDFNNDMVIYIDSKPGGSTSTTNFNDPDSGDALRRAIAGYGGYLGSNRSVVNFPVGFEADYAIAINVNFGGLWELVNNASFPFIDGVGSPNTNTTSSFNFAFDWSEIGATSDEGFSFVVTYLNSVDTAGVFRSDEAVGDGVASGNPGANDISFTNARNYPYYYIFDGTSWSPEDPDGADESCRSAVLLADTDVFSNTTILKEVVVNPQAVLDLDADLSANLHFKSDVTGTAQLANASGVNITGEATVERYIPAGLPDLRRAFRFLTSSVNSTGTINANWQEGATTEATIPNPNFGYGTHITGGASGDGFDQNETGNPSMFTFSNGFVPTGSQTQNDAWMALPNTNLKTLKSGEAYLTFVRGDRGIDVTSNSATPTNTTLRAIGDLHIGSREFSSANNATPTPEYGLSDQADFYSLVGNPYQAIVDFNNLTINNVNSNFYWVWDANMGARGQYATVILPGGSNNAGSQANQFIQPGQSFFVQTISNNPASLTFDEDDKNTSGVATTIFSEQNESSINLLLYSTAAFNTGNRECDGVLINFSANANNAIDQFDADKFEGSDENLARLHNNELISIENRAMPADDEILALSITGYTQDNYTFVVNAANVQSNFEAYLLDNYTGSQTQLNEGATQISFSIDANIPANIVSDRFSLVFENTTLSLNDNSFCADFSLYPNPTNDGRFSIKTQGLSGKDVNIKIHNILGQQVLNQNFKVKNNGDVNMEASGLSSGVYVVELIENEKSFTAKLIVE